MSLTPPFQRMPVELLRAVFVDLDSMSEVANLSCVSKASYRAWKVHARFICSAVVPRSVRCIDDAEALAEVQQTSMEHHERQRQQEDASSKAAVLWARQIHANARRVSLACDFFEADTHPRFPCEAHVHYQTSVACSANKWIRAKTRTSPRRGA